MKYIIGVTGPSGSGKSLFSELAAERGVFCINCDKSARKAAYKGSALLKNLVEVFGEQILSSDGELDRSELAKIAFSSRKNTELLNRTSLPHIVKFVRAEIDSAEENSVVLLDAPTLFESGLDEICNTTVAILADYNLRNSRIIERDNLTEERAELRLKAGKPEEFYTERANMVIYNNSDYDTFCSNCLTILNKILGGIQNG
ncbi:MAG: dephospho-CoA kinase [Clostridia bacterium]|nr:dephospho-CoA kinase [Clostridia bacterium]